MGLNIVVNRKLSLKGFAEGWDDCYLMVRGVNETKRQELQGKLTDDTTDQDAADLMRQSCLEVITGGLVVSTNEDGTTSKVSVEVADVPVVVEALNLAWQREVVSVATGADRLKAMVN